MSEETKNIPQNMLVNPFVAMDFGEKIGREMGELSQRIAHVEDRLDKIETKIEILDAKIDAKIGALEAKFEAKIEALDAKYETRTDKLMNIVARLDERSRLVQKQIWLLGGTTLAAVLAGLIMQLFK